VSTDVPPPEEALLRNLLERVARREVTVDEALPQVQVLSQHAMRASGVASLQAFTTMLQPAIQRQKAAAAWIVGGIFALIGTIFFCVGLGIGWRSLQFLDAPKAPGVITSAGRNPTATYFVNGKEYHTTARISSSPPPFNQGDQCTVLYNPDHPSDAQIDYFVERWLFLVIFGGLGAIFGLIGWLMLFFKMLGRIFRAQPVTIDESQRFTVE
jgi:hypothetical protein